MQHRQTTLFGQKDNVPHHSLPIIGSAALNKRHGSKLDLLSPGIKSIQLDVRQQIASRELEVRMKHRTPTNRSRPTPMKAIESQKSQVLKIKSSNSPEGTGVVSVFDDEDSDSMNSEVKSVKIGSDHNTDVDVNEHLNFNEAPPDLEHAGSQRDDDLVSMLDDEGDQQLDETGDADEWRHGATFLRSQRDQITTLERQFLHHPEFLGNEDDDSDGVVVSAMQEDGLLVSNIHRNRDSLYKFGASRSFHSPGVSSKVGITSAKSPKSSPTGTVLRQTASPSSYSGEKHAFFADEASTPKSAASPLLKQQRLFSSFIQRNVPEEPPPQEFPPDSSEALLSHNIRTGVSFVYRSAGNLPRQIADNRVSEEDGRLQLPPAELANSQSFLTVRTLEEKRKSGSSHLILAQRLQERKTSSVGSLAVSTPDPAPLSSPSKPRELTFVERLDVMVTNALRVPPQQLTPDSPLSLDNQGKKRADLIREKRDKESNNSVLQNRLLGRGGRGGNRQMQKNLEHILDSPEDENIISPTIEKTPKGKIVRSSIMLKNRAFVDSLVSTSVCSSESADPSFDMMQDYNSIAVAQAFESSAQGRTSLRNKDAKGSFIRTPNNLTRIDESGNEADEAGKEEEDLGVSDLSRADDNEALDSEYNADVDTASGVVDRRHTHRAIRNLVVEEDEEAAEKRRQAEAEQRAREEEESLKRKKSFIPSLPSFTTNEYVKRLTQITLGSSPNVLSGSNTGQSNGRATEVMESYVPSKYNVVASGEKLRELAGSTTTPVYQQQNEELNRGLQSLGKKYSRPPQLNMALVKPYSPPDVNHPNWDQEIQNQELSQQLNDDVKTAMPGESQHALVEVDESQRKPQNAVNRVAVTYDTYTNPVGTKASGNSDSAAQRSSLISKLKRATTFIAAAAVPLLSGNASNRNDATMGVESNSTRNNDGEMPVSKPRSIRQLSKSVGALIGLRSGLTSFRISNQVVPTTETLAKAESKVAAENTSMNPDNIVYDQYVKEIKKTKQKPKPRDYKSLITNYQHDNSNDIESQEEENDEISSEESDGRDDRTSGSTTDSGFGSHYSNDDSETSVNDISSNESQKKRHEKKRSNKSQRSRAEDDGMEAYTLFGVSRHDNNRSNVKLGQRQQRSANDSFQTFPHSSDSKREYFDSVGRATQLQRRHEKERRYRSKGSDKRKRNSRKSSKKSKSSKRVHQHFDQLVTVTTSSKDLVAMSKSAQSITKAKSPDRSSVGDGDYEFPTSILTKDMMGCSRELDSTDFRACRPVDSNEPIVVFAKLSEDNLKRHLRRPDHLPIVPVIPDELLQQEDGLPGSRDALPVNDPEFYARDSLLTNAQEAPSRALYPRPMMLPEDSSLQSIALFGSNSNIVVDDDERGYRPNAQGRGRGMPTTPSTCYSPASVISNLTFSHTDPRSRRKPGKQRRGVPSEDLQSFFPADETSSDVDESEMRDRFVANDEDGSGAALLPSEVVRRANSRHKQKQRGRKDRREERNDASAASSPGVYSIEEIKRLTSLYSAHLETATENYSPYEKSSRVVSARSSLQQAMMERYGRDPEGEYHAKRAHDKALEQTMREEKKVFEAFTGEMDSW